MGHLTQMWKSDYILNGFLLLCRIDGESILQKKVPPMLLDVSSIFARDDGDEGCKFWVRVGAGEESLDSID